jgi:hypothetical protein
LIPENIPVSRREEVPRVVEVSQRVAKPVWPPETPEEITPSDDVATQRVEVAVDWRIIPRVPVLLEES